jgi:hypothetical protein
MKFLREFWHACLSVLFSTAPWQDAESVRTTKHGDSWPCPAPESRRYWKRRKI